MSLLHRIARLFKADIHGILDALEEPDIMLKQAVREMQEDIEQSQTQLKSLIKEAQQLSQKIQELTAALAEIERQIDGYFAENNASAVKTLLRKKLETERVLQALDKRRKTLLEEKTVAETELADRQDKLQAVLDKMALFTDQRNDDYLTGYDTHSGGVRTVTQEDIEFAYRQEQQRRAQHQAQRENQP